MTAKGGWAIYRGHLMVDDGDVDRGLALMRTGVDLYARMTALQPKSFAFLYQHLQFLGAYVTLLHRKARSPAAEAALPELLARVSDATAKFPQQRSLFRSIGPIQQSQLQIDRVSKAVTPDDLADNLADADRLARDYGRQIPEVWHNVAIAYKSASRLAPPVDREEYARKAVEHYQDILTSTGYFKARTTAAWIDNTNLRTPIRKRSDFLAFLDRMRELRCPGVTAQAHLIQAFARTGHELHALGVLRGLAALHPKNPDFHHHIGAILRDRGLPVFAELALREAVRQTGNQHGYAIDALVDLLATRGDLPAALAAQRDIVRFKPKGDKAVAEALARLERVTPLQPRLAGVLAGTDRPATPAEAVGFADLCARPFVERYAAAVRWYSEAFADEPELARARNGADRFAAAVAAVRAAADEGLDAPDTPTERAALRAKALAWLRANLLRWQREAASMNWDDRARAAGVLTGWRMDVHLARTRPGETRADMTDGERAAWDQFWEDVAAANFEARSAPPPPPKAPPPRPVNR